MVTEDDKHLCCGEEDVVRYVAHSTRYDTQSDSREDVGVVSLAGVEGASVGQRHLGKRTSTGKDATALKTDRVCVVSLCCFVFNQQREVQ